VTLHDVSATQGGLTVLSGLTWQLAPGEAWLLTGPNGGGKSSFLGLLRGDLSPMSGTRRYVLEGQERVSAVRARRLFPLVSPVQEAWFLTRDWVQTVRDVLLAGAEGEMLNLSEPDDAALARLREVAALTGLEPLLERDFRTLSHGQRRRALLGRALMPGAVTTGAGMTGAGVGWPAALLLDEFTDGLSAQARAELKAVLEAVAAQGVALVLATHRPEEAPALPWKHLRIESGRAVQTGFPFTVQAGLQAAPAPVVLQNDPSQSAPLLVGLENASVYRNGSLALGPIDWAWREGQHWLVTGENGAGKSTLARLVAGEFHPALGGRVVRPFLRRDLLSERRRAIGVVGAELSIRQRQSWTGEQLVGSAFAGTEGFSGELTPAQQEQVSEVAARLGVADLLPRPADTLSQGQLGRLLLARAMVHRPRLLILDEALNFLDGPAQRQVFALLPALMAAGTHLLVIAHRPEDAPPGLTHHLHLSAGMTHPSHETQGRENH